MTRLPYIDEQSLTVGAPPERTWAALVATAARLGGGGPVGTLLGLEPRRASGAMEAGATIPGFAVEEARPPSRLALAGRHRFSRYALVFELEPDGDGRTRVRAKTWAAFPGIHGRAYRALVISSGAHRVAVRLLLQRIEDRAAHDERDPDEHRITSTG
jgi:hypothetical protein